MRWRRPLRSSSRLRTTSPKVPALRASPPCRKSAAALPAARWPPCSPAAISTVLSLPRCSLMNVEPLVAIDVHTHAWKSALAVDDPPSESQQAMGRYFRYQPQHATVPEMAAYYRKLKMAFVVFAVDSPREQRKITNEEIAELAQKNGDVAIPFASVNPHRGAEGVRLARKLISDYGV